MSETSEGRGSSPAPGTTIGLLKGWSSLQAPWHTLPDVGSHVRLKLTTHDGDTEIDGVVLPPAVAEHITVKLANGYNISHPLSSIEILSCEQPKTIESIGSDMPTTNPDLPTVRIVHTGGTIASKVDYTTGAVTAQFEPSELVEHVPELQSIANLDVHKIGNMFSEDIRPNHWNQIIDASEKAFADGCVGVVVTHGTDTLHITASAVAFAWCGNGGNPPGRIAFVGSQRSSDRASSDAAQNLISAVKWAAEGPQPLVNSAMLLLFQCIQRAMMELAQSMQQPAFVNSIRAEGMLSVQSIQCHLRQFISRTQMSPSILGPLQ